MSEAQKPVEETPVVAPAATEPAPAAEAAAPAETPAEPAPAATEAATEAAEEPAKEEPKAEVKPATDGVLGFKGPGLVKGFRFSKRFFWFSEEAVEVKQLSAYFQNEKPAVAHPTAAWASQTGKGLLFSAKRAEDKATPAGIINLSDISDLAKDGGNEFHFKVNGHKLVFQASSGTERDSWIAGLEAKVAEANAEKEVVVASEGYKGELEKLTKPITAVIAAAAPKKSEEAKGKEADKKEEPKDESAAPAEQDKKSRSQSRKRSSIFGGFLNKKEESEKKEEKKEEKKPETEETPAAEPSAAAEEPAAATEPAAEAAAPAEEAKPETKAEAPAATKAKRSSIFGNFFHKAALEKKDEKKPEAEETSAVSSTAPQLGDPVDAATSEPIKPETVTSAPESSEPAKPAEETTTSPSSTKAGFLNFIKKEKTEEKKETKEAKPEDKKAEDAEAPAESAAAAETPAPPALKEKRRTSLFGNLGSKKEKKADAAEGEAVEGETKAKSPVPKLGSLFRRPSRANKEKEAAAAPSESEPIPEGTEKSEPAADAPAEAAAVNGTEVTENKETAAAPAAATSSQPVQAAA
ncbi:hypothetical protein AJ80_07914 [Polytolypa hystricis UAMH7299]|uniref:PH domain-containing protein n=1 Tax=Polytolypa hystricis (strain UAMH7299) TaxID=1447883 RepID=A0A2B7XGS8_POLH7|nr:hypothetical protein AJ80_07914 [Polytolypa hystricis UAMH7299]